MNETQILEKAYVISIKGSKRRISFHQNTGKHLINGYEFFDAIDTRSTFGKQIGCISSHRALIQMAKDNNLDHITVFEDDATFIPDNSNSLNSLCYLPNYTGLVFLSNFRRDHFRSENYKDNLTVLHGGFTCCHAIQYHKPFYDMYLERYPKDLQELRDKRFSAHNNPRAIDQWMRLLAKDIVIFGLEPRPFLGNWCSKESSRWQNKKGS